MEVTVGLALYINAVLFVAAALLQITGFGFMMLAAPALVIVVSPQMTVPMLVVVWLPLGVVMVWNLRHDVDGSILRCFSFPALVGIPLGALILRDTDPQMMQRIIGAMMIVLALILQVKPGEPFRRELPWRMAAGAISGILASSTSVAGPPVVLLGLKQRWEPAVFRATLVTFFFVCSVASLPFYWHLDLLEQATLELAATAFPGVAAGYVTGTWVKGRVGGRSFRWLAMGVVTTGGLVAVLL